MAGLIDSHLHLYRSDFEDDRAAVRSRAIAAGVIAWLHVGYDGQSNRLAQEALASDRGRAWCSAGIHPHDAVSYGPEAEEWMREVARAGRIVAIGECGLDYYRDLSPRQRQDEALRGQIALAKSCQLPMIHHVRDAYSEVRQLLLEEGLPPRRGIFHAFAGDREFARWAVGEGYKLGIGGPLTYPRSRLPEAIEGLPPDAFQLETDAPWLPPQPWRGRRNEPAYLRVTAQHLAALLGRPLEELAELWARQFEQLFAVELSAEFWQCELVDCPPPEGKQKRK